jgi:hypothetical protein
VCSEGSRGDRREKARGLVAIMQLDDRLSAVDRISILDDTQRYIQAARADESPSAGKGRKLALRAPRSVGT